jgi:branched-chain amino acid transport system substrate-binding protein
MLGFSWTDGEVNMLGGKYGTWGIAVFGLAVVTLANSGDVFAKEKVKIAFVGPLTGAISQHGIGGRNSAELAVKLKNADPATKYEYELVAMDDECKPNIGVQVVTKIASDNSIVAAIPHYCSAVAIATVDIFHRFKLPMVVPFCLTSPTPRRSPRFIGSAAHWSGRTAWVRNS